MVTDRIVPTLVDIPASPGGDPSARLRLRFGRPARWLVAWSPREAPGILDAAHTAAVAGAWCVGWVTYEAAPGIDGTLSAGLHVHAPLPGEPVAAFAVFDGPVPESPPVAAGSGPWDAGPWREDPASRRAFAANIDTIRDRIRDGDVYQINLTAPLRASLTGDPLAYFEALRRSQPHGYTFFIPYPPGAVEARILSVSPELFFHWQGRGITAQPMKGTAPRGADPAADDAAAGALRSSEKERAENLMIVDLLRNDLSRLAAIGSVRVPRLFELHALPTVWQMTSTITATARDGTRLSDVFAALFPCGSVTGAPKRSAMALIHALEPAPRGVYCGAIGLLKPGGEAIFNVPIRTVTLRAATAAEQDPGEQWTAACGVGSGITYDSRADAEAREWHDKQGFLRRAARPFELLETLRLDDGQWWLLDRHLARLRRCAGHFGYPLPPNRVHEALGRVATAHPDGMHRVRLLVDEKGGVRCETVSMPPQRGPVRLAWAQRPFEATDEFVRHKTTRREAYVPFVQPPGGGRFDTLLRRADGRITETTFGNVAFRIDGRWCTPALDAGLLPGVYREALVDEGRLHERTITVDDLAGATGCAFLNSVRGWLDVDWDDLRVQIDAWSGGGTT